MTRRPFFVGVAFVLIVTAAAAVLQVLTDPEHVQPDHVARPEAGASAPLPLAAVGGESDRAATDPIVAFVEGVVREQERLAAEEAERVEAARRAQDEPRVAAGTGPGGAGGCGADWDCFRECTIDHESRSAGEYGAVSPGGTYRGAFQFLASTWRSVAVNAGYGEWADVPVDQVPSAVQDAVARFLWEHSGTRPWGGRCG